MKKDVYRLLQKHLDRMPIPFPATESGVELRLLKHLFSVEEAEVALCLSALPEPASKIYRRLKRKDLTVGRLEVMLKRLYKKGAIRGVRSRNGTIGRYRYSKVPLAIGMFEFQVDRITKKFAEDFFEYEKEAFAGALLDQGTKQMRTVPVNVSIDPEFHVGQYDDIRAIIKQSPGPFGVMNCVCRQAKDQMGKSCTHTDIRETCLTMEGAVESMKDLGVCREITREEALKILTKAKKAGLVLQPENTQHPHFVCCCCGCCCGVLTAAKFYDKPASFLHSNFQVEVDPEKCDGCDTCLERCQMDALKRENGYMKADPDRCIGCGLCVPTCRQHAIRLIKKDKEWVPPKRSNDMYKQIMMERFGIWGSMKIAGKAILGLKI